MKKLIVLFMILCSFGVSPVSAKAVNLEKVDKHFLGEYDVSRINADIKTRSDKEGVYGNSVQMLSKYKTWNKKIFDNFTQALKKRDTTQAAKIYEKNWKIMSPFLRTPTNDSEYLAFRPLRNGIITLSVGGNGGDVYYFTYIFYNDNKLYEISSDSNFYCWDGTGLKYNRYGSYPVNVDTEKIKSDYLDDNGRNKFLISWFNDIFHADSDFQYEYSKFIDRMSEIWK